MSPLLLGRAKSLCLQNDLPIISAFIKVINMIPKVLILTRFLLPALSPVFLKFETNHGKK